MSKGRPQKVASAVHDSYRELFRPDPPIVDGETYRQSLRGRGLNVRLFGERIEEPVDHPIIRSSINAVAATFDLAAKEPDLATACSSLSNRRVNRFLQITESIEDVVAQSHMQRRLGQMTGTCFQRCVGMDAINSLHSVTFEIDEKHGTPYHGRLQKFVRYCQEENLVIGGAMTDPKGDRSKGPSEQSDPDLYTRIVERREDGLVIRGAKSHQTGCINSHWIIVMPTARLREADRAYAVIAAIPVQHPGLTYVYGRQPCDTRALESGTGIDQGNVMFGGQEAMIIIDDVFVPWEFVLMDGEVEFAATLVERFTTYHRRSYVCKSGVGDVVIGAAAQIAEYHGVEKASHIRDKLVEMTHLNETIYGTGIAASQLSTRTKSGNYENDPMLANVCKQNVTRFPFALARLAQDLAGGLMVTLPSDADFDDPELGPLLEKYLRVKDGVSVEDRRRILRLIECMTLGRNAVGYLTESMHGAGSPQAQRVHIRRAMKLDEKKRLARKLAGVRETTSARERKP
jgi:4-hydroxybutyryl-CoA dehydratase/vinylacetyl-CoA-Delta-isomerase